MSRCSGPQGRGFRKKLRAVLADEAYQRQVRYWQTHHAALEPVEMLPRAEREKAPPLPARLLVNRGASGVDCG